MTTQRDTFTATVTEVADVLVRHGVDLEVALHESTDFVVGLIRKALAEVPAQRPAVDAVLAELSA